MSLNFSRVVDTSILASALWATLLTTYTLSWNAQQTFSPVTYRYCLPHCLLLSIQYPMQVLWTEIAWFWLKLHGLGLGCNILKSLIANPRTFWDCHPQPQNLLVFWGQRHVSDVYGYSWDTSSGVSNKFKGPSENALLFFLQSITRNARWKLKKMRKTSTTWLLKSEGQRRRRWRPWRLSITCFLRHPAPWTLSQLNLL